MILINFDQIWSSLIKFDQIWSNFIFPIFFEKNILLKLKKYIPVYIVLFSEYIFFFVF